ncbi:MAG: hypothetical protein M0R74_07290 [Dehalococcoidia bacterium]|nr:hypothetical protein [Dehalococcoidia bacterium]
MRADTNDVAFRLLLALGDLWDGLQRANIDPSRKGLHLTKEYLGGYTRYSAGPAARARLVVEWNESSRHLRVLRCEEWPGFSQVISSTVAFVRDEARGAGLTEIVDSALVKACQEPTVSTRRTVTPTAAAAIARRTAVR